MANNSTTELDLLKSVTTSGGPTDKLEVNATIASNVISSGTRANAPARIDYSSTNVTTADYVEVVASLSNAVKALYIFDSSGSALVLATGAAAAEVDQIYIEPGGTGQVLLSIPAGTRLSVKAVDSTASQGQLLIAFLG